MLDQIAALIVDESKWLSVSMGLALFAVAVLLASHRASRVPGRQRVAAAMNLFFGVMIGTMAFGHLLAVTTKFINGTLQGALPLLGAIGIVLAVPAWCLILHARRLITSDGTHWRTTLVLNAWLALTLAALGIHNLPLAVPGVLNIGYSLHSRRAVGWALVSLAVAVNSGLFVGSLVFLASGQSFEQFRGIR